MSRIVYVAATRHPGASQWPLGQVGLQVGDRLAVQHGDRITVVSAGLYDLTPVIDPDGMTAFEEWATATRVLRANRAATGSEAAALERDAREQAEHVLASIAEGELASQVIAPMQERERTLLGVLKARGEAA